MAMQWPKRFTSTAPEISGVVDIPDIVIPLTIADKNSRVNVTNSNSVFGPICLKSEAIGIAFVPGWCIVIDRFIRQIWR